MAGQQCLHDNGHDGIGLQSPPLDRETAIGTAIAVPEPRIDTAASIVCHRRSIRCTEVGTATAVLTRQQTRRHRSLPPAQLKRQAAHQSIVHIRRHEPSAIAARTSKTAGSTNPSCTRTARQSWREDSVSTINEDNGQKRKMPRQHFHP